MSGTERRLLDLGERIIEKLGAAPEEPPTIAGFGSKRPRQKFTRRPTLKNLTAHLDENE